MDVVWRVRKEIKQGSKGLEAGAGSICTIGCHGIPGAEDEEGWGWG